MQPGRGYLVLASYLPLKRFASTPRFLLKVWAIRQQLSSAYGLVGYALRARPLARDYWTLSVWEGAQALNRFVQSPPHAHVMSSLQPFMGTTKFQRWTIDAADGPPQFAFALSRLSGA
jgi:hypothetical protein